MHARSSLLFVALAFVLDTSASPYNIRDFGARGDKSTNDAPALQAAIDACHNAGGGEVLVPAGNYLAGKITLRSQITLKLEPGATIWASARAQDYSPHPGDKGEWYLFVAEGQENITITGEGAVQGTGQNDLDRREPEGVPLPSHRFGIARFSNCTDVHLGSFKILFSDWHTVIFSRCANVFVNGLAIINNFFHTNSDGLDPESCTNVFISNCYIIAGDDCICPKTEVQLPLENLVVENCILESVAAAFKLGTGSHGDFRDIKVSNCVIRNSGVGLGIFIKDGGTAERISFSNISITTTDQSTPINSRLRNNIIPIYIDIEQRDDQSRIGAVRDVTFRDIQIESDNGLLIQGMPERAIENMTLQNITFRVNQGFDFSERKKRAGGRSNPHDSRITKFIRQPTYLALAHIDGLVLDNIRVLIRDDVVKQFDRSAVSLFESKNVVIKDLQSRPVLRAPASLPANFPPAERPVITLSNCQEVLVANCLALPGTPTFLGLTGEKTRDIHLVGNELSGAAKVLVRGKEVPADAVSGNPK